MNFMYDWATFRAPCFHPDLISGGKVMKVRPDGTLEWEVTSHFPVVGSHDSNLMIRTFGLDVRDDGSDAGAMLEVSGNPTKWLQGHNLFGGFVSLGALLEMTMYRLCELLPGLQPHDIDRAMWRGGRAFEVTRVDVNTMIGLGTRERARAWVRAAEQTGYMRHRGRGTLMRNGTVYWGMGSKRSSAKVYVKGDELEAGKGHGLKEDLPHRDELIAWANDKDRFEVMLRSMDLRKRGLNVVANWRDDTAPKILLATAEGLNMSGQALLPNIDVSTLPRNLRVSYEAWKGGADLREILPARTFYRHRKQLLPLGVDIGVLMPREKPDEVVPLRQVLEAYPATIPEWAYGTSLLVGPSDLEAARRRFLERRAA